MIDRYAIPEMTEIWSRESRFRRWLEIEMLAVEARAEQGLVPPEDLELIRKKASFDIRRIDEVESRVRHDVIAFLTSVSESLGPESRHIHYGMTSSDILDTCLATQIRDAGGLISKALRQYRRSLAALVERTRGMACMGRTHGMYAEPTTMALKMAGFLSEADRCRKRLDEGLEEACRGKISGAVGTYAHLDPSVEEYVCRRLGIGHETVSTQVVPRDRHAAFLYALCAIGAALERFATEVRHLQRTEVGEAEERFGGGQKGSSAMPHKRNPIVSERLCGMARLLRGYLMVGLEDTALWHERDISHSSAERFVFPDACGVALYALRKGADLASGLTIDERAVRRNLKAAGDRFYSQSVMLALVDAGMGREDAYALVQRLSMEAMESGRSMLEAMLASPELQEKLPEKRIREVCSLQRHLRNETEILERVDEDD